MHVSPFDPFARESLTRNNTYPREASFAHAPKHGQEQEARIYFGRHVQHPILLQVRRKESVQHSLVKKKTLLDNQSGRDCLCVGGI